VRLLTCLLLASCAAPVVEPERLTLHRLDYVSEVVFDASVLPWQREESDWAFADWTYATGDSFRFSLVPSPDARPWTLRSGPVDGHAGECDLTNRIITIDEDNGRGGWSLVLLHELGHAARGDARHFPGTLMDENNAMPCIDRFTVDTVCDLRGCAERRATCNE
jgi:hypothetical protein